MRIFAAAAEKIAGSIASPAMQTKEEALAQREESCNQRQADLDEQQQAMQAKEEALAQREESCNQRQADLVEQQQQAEKQTAAMQTKEEALARQYDELHKRAAEVQSRHTQMERERVAALQDACTHCAGLVLHNTTKTTLCTVSDAIAEHCGVAPTQIVEAAPGSKYPLLALFTPGSGRVTELAGIDVDTVQAWREQFLAPRGRLILALLRSGRDPPGISKDALAQLQERGFHIDVLLDFCLDSGQPVPWPFHPPGPAASKMNQASFAQVKELMPPPPPPPADFGSLFSWHNGASPFEQEVEEILVMAARCETADPLPVCPGDWQGSDAMTCG